MRSFSESFRVQRRMKCFVILRALVLLLLTAGSLCPSISSAQSSDEAIAQIAQSPAMIDHDKTAKDNKDDEVIRKLLQQKISGQKFPGIVAAIARRGEPIRIAAAGVRKWDHPTPLESGDLLHMGSCTKAMTAALAARLVERRRIGWTTTIKEALPKIATIIDSSWHDVTLRQLLMHRSGLPANPPNWNAYLDQPVRSRREKFAIAAMAKPALVEPEGAFEYSNLGYVVAGAMLEATSDQSWESLIQEEVFGPLEMTSAGFGQIGDGKAIVQPWGHVYNLFGNPRPIVGDNPAAMGPAGTAHMSMLDWSKFVLQFVDGADEEFLTDISRRKMLTPGPDNDYALGWFVVDREWANGKALNHAGSNTMWYALVWCSPKNEVAYLVVMNCHSAGTTRFADQMIGSLIELDDQQVPRN